MIKERLHVPESLNEQTSNKGCVAAHINYHFPCIKLCAALAARSVPPPARCKVPQSAKMLNSFWKKTSDYLQVLA